MRLFSDATVRAMLEEGWWTGETWTDRFRQNVAANPESVAVVDAINKESFLKQQPTRLTWRELDNAVDRCAALFFENGLRPGDVIGVQIPNSVELVITYLALNRIGVIISPYPMPYRRHEIETLARIAGVRGFVTAAGFHSRVLIDIGEVAEDIEGADKVFVWHGQDDRGVPISLDEIRKEGPSPSPAYQGFLTDLRPHPNDCVLILFTSGTTGVPKGVPRAHGDSMVSAATNVALPSLTPRDVVLNSMPMVNAGSIGGIFLPWLLSGCCLVQHQPFDLHTFARQIEQEKVTYTVVSPTVLNEMVAENSFFEQYDLSSMRCVGAGSAPISGWTIRRWEEDHGVEVINFFGATEGLQLSADPDTVPDPSMRGKSLPVPGSPRFNWRTRMGRESKVRLVDLATGEDIVEPGRPGELRFKAPSLFSGYLGRIEDAFDEQGYFSTGDIFEYSADAPDMLVHVDRKKDLIIRGGLNISAVEIETLLVGQPKVAEVAAIGRRDDRLGERVCVFVVPRHSEDPPTLADIQAHLDAGRVAKYKWPESVQIVAALPRNPSGKVLKHELRRELNGDASAVV
ncbi:class I adenylate-forming enzyme family protein [Streptosporangium sp. NPDC087985]|uniref:class I adenylate-forming enzyme family protein n=1 Tax=Streptosporangium sp. NPDC087985 TaxID=3366196 RepID=UPI0038050939